MKQSVDGPSKIVHEALLRVSCIGCGKLHSVEHLLASSPVCPACAAKRSAMRPIEMNSSYPLTHEAIDEVLTRRSPGNYTLGYMDGTTFVVFYVGRSDFDVGRILHDWVGAPSRNDRYAPASKAAWASCRGDGLMPLDRPAHGRVQNAETSYTRFAYSYARSAEQAYAEEWRNYDDFGGSHALDNETQPVSAVG